MVGDNQLKPFVDDVGVVKQDDLVKALEEKLIAGAALDVMTPEPLPHDHPLTRLSNVGKYAIQHPV